MVLRTCNKIQNLGLQNIFPDNTRQCTNFSVYLKSYIALGTYNTQKQKESFQKQLIPCVRRKTLMRVQLSRVSYSVSGRNQIMCATFSYKQVAQNLFENLQIIKQILIVFFFCRTTTRHSAGLPGPTRQKRYVRPYNSNRHIKKEF